MRVLVFKARLLSLLLAVVLCQVPLIVNAQEPLPDVRMLIDVSGSMRQSDPDNLREPALELMVQLLPEGSRAGVWTFGQWVNMVVPHADVDDQWRADAIAAVAAISNAGLLTNIPDAIELATFDIQRLQHQYRTSIILLTDGKVEVTDDALNNQRAARDLLEKVAPELRDWGVTVHTIALSDDADWDFLRALAQATGGLAERASSPEALSAVFLQALDIAAPTEQVPLLGGEFLIDDSVSEFTVLVFPDADAGGVQLLDPNEQPLIRESSQDNMQWFHHERFELITISNPAAGLWRILAPGSIARVNVISHLSLAVDRLPVTMPSGHSPEFGLRLLDADEVITDPELLDLLDLSVRIRRSDNEQWELSIKGASLDASGEFRVNLPMLAEPGRYEIVAHIDGRSFQREVTMVTDVLAPEPAQDPATAFPVETPREGIPGWLLPAAVSAVLLLGILVWWYRRRETDDWEEEEFAEDEDTGDTGLDDPLHADRDSERL